VYHITHFTTYLWRYTKQWHQLFIEAHFTNWFFLLITTCIFSTKKLPYRI